MQLTSTQKSFAAWCLIVTLLSGVLWLLSPVLAPFVVASVLAYALTPVVDWLDNLGRGRIPRVVAVVVVELLFVLVLIGVFLLMVPILAKELPLMRDQLPAMMDSVNRALDPLLRQWGVQVSLDGASIKAFVMKYFNANVEDVFGSVMTSIKLGGSVALAVIGNAVLIPVALFYLLMDWNHFLSKLHQLIPPRLRGWTENFLGEVDWVLGQYLRGQLLVMLILAAFYSAGLLLFGLDLALPIGVFTGLAICTLCGIWYRFVVVSIGGLAAVFFRCRRGGPDFCNGSGRVWVGPDGREFFPDASFGRRAYWPAPPCGHFCLARIRADVWLRGGTDCIAGECRVAGGHSSAQDALP